MRNFKYKRRPTDIKYILIEISFFIVFILLLLVVISKLQNISKHNDKVLEEIIGIKKIVEEPRYTVYIEYVEREGTVEEQIREIAEEYNFKWIDYLIRLAKCESSLDPKAINGKNNKPITSVDRGLFQINDYWHSEVDDNCAYSTICSTKWTMQRINDGYQHEWVCDRYI